MKKALTLAVLGALAASPALAAGGQQHSDMQSQKSGQSAQLDQNTIRQVQQQLQQQGYEVGQVDGVWGPRSQQALTTFQRDQNIRASGRPDQETLAALGVQSDSQQAQTPEDQEGQQSQGGGLWGR